MLIACDMCMEIDTELVNLHYFHDCVVVQIWYRTLQMDLQIFLSSELTVPIRKKNNYIIALVM